MQCFESGSGSIRIRIRLILAWSSKTTKLILLDSLLQEAGQYLPRPVSEKNQQRMDEKA